MFWGKFMNAKFRCNIITFLKRNANLVIHMFWWFFSLWFKFWMKAQMPGWNFLSTWLWKKKTIEKVVRLVFCSLEKEEKIFCEIETVERTLKNSHHHADTCGSCGTQLYRNRPPVIDSCHSCMFIGHAGCFGKNFEYMK